MVIYNSVYDSIYNWWVKCFDELSIIFDILMILYICDRNVILQSRFLMESPFVKTLVRKQYIYSLKSYNSICTIKSSAGSHVSNNQMLDALVTFLQVSCFTVFRFLNSNVLEIIQRKFCGFKMKREPRQSS